MLSLFTAISWAVVGIGLTVQGRLDPWSQTVWISILAPLGLSFGASGRLFLICKMGTTIAHTLQIEVLLFFFF